MRLSSVQGSQHQAVSGLGVEEGGLLGQRLATGGDLGDGGEPGRAQDEQAGRGAAVDGGDGGGEVALVDDPALEVAHPEALAQHRPVQDLDVEHAAVAARLGGQASRVAGHQQPAPPIGVQAEGDRLLREPAQLLLGLGRGGGRAGLEVALQAGQHAGAVDVGEQPVDGQDGRAVQVGVDQEHQQLVPGAGLAATGSPHGVPVGERGPVAVVAVGDQHPLAGHPLAPGRDPLRVGHHPQPVPDPGLVGAVQRRLGRGHVVEHGRRPTGPGVDPEHRGEVGPGRLQQAQPVGHGRGHGPLVGHDPAAGVVQGDAGQHPPLCQAGAAKVIGLFIEIETWRRIAAQHALGHPAGQQLGHVAVVGAAVALGLRGGVVLGPGQNQPDHVVGALGLVGVAGLGRDDVVGRGGDQAVVADDGAVVAQAAEGSGGYHGAAGLGLSVMAVFVASAGRRRQPGCSPHADPGGPIIADTDRHPPGAGAPPSSDGPAAAGAGALAARFQGVVFDLDGVVYLGEEVVPAAPGALDQVRGLGVKVAFVTNNSYRPPGQVVEKLNRLGVKAAEDEVLTSAQAAVRLLGGREGLDGIRVLVVGGPGLRQALEEAGARLVDGPAWAEAEVVAVGFDPELTYARVRDATLAIRAGARFVGSNPDTTLPTGQGLWPGAGATLALLRASTGVRPEVAGKPERALLETAAAAIGPGPYLMVGDRADTDLDGAHRLGWSTALVLSGVTGLADLPDLANAPDQLLTDVGGLLDPPGPVVRLASPEDQAAAGRLLGVGEDGERRRLVAVEAERVVGAVAVRRGGTPGLLEGPVVTDGWRDRLVGTRLVAAACSEARAAGLARVGAPRAAEAFLGRLGFHPAADGDSLVRDL